MKEVKYLPLIVSEGTPCVVVTKDDRRISVNWSSHDGEDDKEAEKFAAFIVHACNEFYNLVEFAEAVEKREREKDYGSALHQYAIKIIAKAKGAK